MTEVIALGCSACDFEEERPWMPRRQGGELCLVERRVSMVASLLFSA